MAMDTEDKMKQSHESLNPAAAFLLPDFPRLKRKGKTRNRDLLQLLLCLMVGFVQRAEFEL